MSQDPSADWAIITPSYSGDFRRCQLLCRSIDQFVSGIWHHYLVVDQQDFALFKPLSGPNRSVVLVNDILPQKQKRLFKIPFYQGRDLWWSRETGFSIGWHVQQMIKIAMAGFVKQAGLLHCDSDMFFVRPFDLRSLYVGQKFRLYRELNRRDLSAISNPAFVKSCLNIMGLPQGGSYHSYIDTLVAWRRESALAMCEYLARRFHGNWQKAFKNRINISEYNLYGLYVDEIAPEQAVHFASDQFLCKTHWANKSLTEQEIAIFFNTLAPQEVALCFQSFAGVDMDLIEMNYNMAASQHNGCD
jgi:Family of unknown function (DUF6492)